MGHSKLVFILIVAVFFKLGSSQSNDVEADSKILSTQSNISTAATSTDVPGSTTQPSEPQHGPAQAPKQTSFSFPARLQALMGVIRESENEYGHVEVRRGANLFWWLYFADGKKEDAHTKPFVIWIQGGPSIPGSGLGNFVEIGPLTLTLKKRSHSWVKGKNVLFVDSPVGTGYSHVTDDDLLCKTDKEVAADLIQLMKVLLEKFPQFKATPTHIFSQSYGTKIASYFAYYLYKDIKKGNIDMTLKTVALGGSWVNPKETSLATSEYLYQTGFLDKPEYLRARNLYQNLTAMLDRKEYLEAFKYRLQIIHEIFNDDSLINGNNVFEPRDDINTLKLTSLMNGLVSFTLGTAYIRRGWSFINEDVIMSLSQDFMKPVQHVVEKILTDTDLRVVVYNGDFDSVTPMAGAVNWVHSLQWPGRERFWSSKRQLLNGQGNGFFKEHDRLSLWWILKAGHWVPTDNPEAMEQLLQYVVHENKDIFPQAAHSKQVSKESAATPVAVTSTEPAVTVTASSRQASGENAIK